MNCPQCNTWLPDGVKFCSCCGTALTVNNEPQAAPVQPEIQNVFQPEPQMTYQPEPQPEPQVAYQPEPQPEPQMAYQPEPQHAPYGTYQQQYTQSNYYSAPQYNQPIYNTHNNITEHDLPEKFSPLGAWAYFGLSLLFSLPVIGFIFLIVFSFNDSNRNRRNFARSYWCGLLILAIIIAIFVTLIAVGVGSLDYMF